MKATGLFKQNVGGRLPSLIVRWGVGVAVWAALISAGRGEVHSLEEVWLWSTELQPGFEIVEANLAAEESAGRAIQAERRPAFSIEAGGDYGQRVRPGEERDQGVAGRGEIMARVNWNIYDSGRAARERAVELRRLGVIEAGDAFEHAFRAEVARAYVDLSLAVERWERLREAHEGFVRLAGLVEMRIAADVEPAATGEWVEARRAVFRARLHAQEDVVQAAAAGLRTMAGREVRPTEILPNVDEIFYGHDLDGNPELARLRAEAATMRAESVATEREGRWRVDLFGAAGPYFSEAFDDRMKEEYIGGVRLAWTPDIAGVQRERTREARYRSRAGEVEEARLRRAYEERLAELGHLLRDAAIRQAEHSEAVSRSERAEQSAELRWREGVALWRDFNAGMEDTLDARLEELEWRSRMAANLIEFAEITAALDQLPAWLGQSQSSTGDDHE